jgi:hypothetical protein
MALLNDVLGWANRLQRHFAQIERARQFDAEIKRCASDDGPRNGCRLTGAGLSTCHRHANTERPEVDEISLVRLHEEMVRAIKREQERNAPTDPRT